MPKETAELKTWNSRPQRDLKKRLAQQALSRCEGLFGSDMDQQIESKLQRIDKPSVREAFAVSSESGER